MAAIFECVDVVDEIRVVDVGKRGEVLGRADLLEGALAVSVWAASVTVVSAEGKDADPRSAPVRAGINGAAGDTDAAAVAERGDEGAL